MGIDVDRIEKDVRESIKAVGAKYGGKRAGNLAWTLQLKVNLIDLAEQYGFRAFAGRCKPIISSEWLYDVCWLEIKDEKVVDVPLVCESEWDLATLGHDFDKLLVARARLRVMVFETKNPSETKETFEKLKEYVGAFGLSVPGDRYLFAAWEGGKEFKFEPYCHRP